MKYTFFLMSQIILTVCRSHHRNANVHTHELMDDIAQNTNLIKQSCYAFIRTTT